MKNLCFLLFVLFFFNCKKKNSNNFNEQIVLKHSIPEKSLILSEDFLLYDKNDKKTHILKLLEKYEKTIVLRFTDLNCSLCYESALKILEKYKKYENIIIISSFQNTRAFKLFLAQSKCSLKIFKVDENVLKDLNVPYFFTVDENFTINSFLIHEKKKPKKTIEYLDTVIKN